MDFGCNRKARYPPLACIPSPVFRDFATSTPRAQKGLGETANSKRDIRGESEMNFGYFSLEGNNTNADYGPPRFPYTFLLLNHE